MDRKCLLSIRRNVNLHVVWYMIYQYLYHTEGLKIISDRAYKVVRAGLLWNWDEIDHACMDMLSKDDIICDITFSRYSDSYPTYIVTCGKLYLKEYEARKDL